LRLAGRSTTVTAVVAVVGVALLVPAIAAADTGPSPARSSAPAPNPLTDASSAATRVNFLGQLQVVWVDNVGQHQVSLSVSANGGVVDVDGPLPVVADRQGRLVRDSDGWTLLWPDSDALADAAEAAYAPKYQLSDGPGPSVAGRPTTEVVLRVGDAVRELVELDVATGLPLERAVLNPDGTLVRVVRFNSVDIRPSVPDVAPLPKAKHSAAPRPAAAAHLAAPFEAPVDLASGYHRVGLFHGADGLQVLYSDGVDTLSVFEQPGTLSRRSLPPGSVAVTVRAQPAAVWAWPGGQVATWQNGPAVFTVVGDGPLSDVLAAAASVPPARRVSWSQRLRHACRRLVSELV
jgi:hypothetical protein